MFECCMCGEHRVVRLNHRGRQLRCGIHAEFELRFLAIICRETLEKEGTEARAGTTTEGVEDEEALEASAVVRQPTDLVHGWIDKFFPNGIVAACICRSTCASTRASWLDEG